MFSGGDKGVKKKGLLGLIMVEKKSFSPDTRHIMILLDPFFVLIPKILFSFVLQFGVRVSLWHRVAHPPGFRCAHSLRQDCAS